MAEPWRGCEDAVDDHVEQRNQFTLEKREGKRRQVVRIWVRFPRLKKTIPFPSPIVPRSKWKVPFNKLCDKHKIKQMDDGKVAEVSCEDGLQQVIKRNISLAPEGAGRSVDWPLHPPVAFDAVSWGHRKVTANT